MRIIACPKTLPRLLQVGGAPLSLPPLPVFSLDEIEQQIHMDALTAPLQQERTAYRWSYLIRAQHRADDLKAMDQSITPAFDQHNALFATRGWLEDILDDHPEQDTRVLYFFTAGTHDVRHCGALVLHADSATPLAGHITHASDASIMHQNNMWFSDYLNNCWLADWHKIYELLIAFSQDDEVINFLTLTIENGSIFRFHDLETARFAYQQHRLAAIAAPCHLNIRMLADRHRSRVEYYVLNDQSDTADLLTRIEKDAVADMDTTEPSAP